MDDPAGEEFVGEVGMKLFKHREVVRGETTGSSKNENGFGCLSGSFPTPALSLGERENYTPISLHSFIAGPSNNFPRCCPSIT
jgi:hypothetical protein